MQISGKSILGVLVAVVGIALALYVWPTAWAYHSGGILIGAQVAPIETRVNRFTGRVQYLTLAGWDDPVETGEAATPTPIAPPPAIPPPTPTPE